MGGFALDVEEDLRVEGDAPGAEVEPAAESEGRSADHRGVCGCVKGYLEIACASQIHLSSPMLVMLLTSAFATCSQQS